MFAVSTVESRFGIQTEVSFSLILVRAMTEKTVIRKDRTDIAIKLNRLRQSILSIQCLRSPQQQTGRSQQRS
jgi:hypothetical protein